VTFVKHEGGDTEPTASLAASRGRRIGTLLETIADIDQRADFGAPRFGGGMSQHAAQLRRAGAASDHFAMRAASADGDVAHSLAWNSRMPRK